MSPHRIRNAPRQKQRESRRAEIPIERTLQMSHGTSNPTLSVAAAAAVAAAALMTSPATGNASPLPLAPGDCNGYEFIDGNFVLNQSDGLRVEFPAHAQEFANQTATSYDNHQDVANTGTTYGAIHGKTVEFRIEWNGGPVGVYRGTVRDNLTVSGSTKDRASGATATWDSVTPLTCIA